MMKETIGSKIHNLREAKSISLEDCAERANIARDQLEMIETGKVLPSMGVLTKIVRVLGVRLGTFLDGMEQDGPVVTRGSELTGSISFSSNDPSSREHLDFFSMAEGKNDRHMDPFVIKVSKSTEADKKLSHHEGEEFIYVLEGEINFIYGNQADVLKTGDSVYYNSIIPHHLSAAGDKDAKILAVVYVPM